MPAGLSPVTSPEATIGSAIVEAPPTMAASADVSAAKAWLSALSAAFVNSFTTLQEPAASWLKNVSTFEADRQAAAELTAEAQSAPNWADNAQALAAKMQSDLGTALIVGGQLQNGAMTVLDPTAGLSSLAIAQHAEVIAALLDELRMRRDQVLTLQAQLAKAGGAPAPGAAPKTVTTGQATAIGVGGVAVGALAAKLIIDALV